MKYFLVIPVFASMIFIFGVSDVSACHETTDAERDERVRYAAFIDQAEDDGYRCEVRVTFNGQSCDRATVTCTTNNATIYDAERISDVSLRGFTTIGAASRYFFLNYYNSPFIYLQNPPTGTIALSLRSALNTYFPKPAFNQEHGWVVESEQGKISIDGYEQNHLFYELSINNILLNRNGRNFTSKDEVVVFLQQSDFLAKLGFTEEEKKNSLDYFLPKLEASPDKKFYYLTVLDDTSIAKISELNIDPKPKEVLVKYFALYPTNVAVTTTGDFVFPEHAVSNKGEYTVAVTGEFLVDPSMVIFWNK